MLARNTLARAFKAQSRASGLRQLSTKTIQETLAEVIPERQEYAKSLRKEHGDKVLGQVTVEQVFGGMRGIKAMLWEPSVLDSEEGIRFWGRSIPECQEVLPTAPGGKEMLPEAMFWYLLTSKVPTAEETVQFQNELASRAPLDPSIEKVLDALPKTMHPMTQFVIGVAALNQHSAFAKQYTAGMKKADYWKPTLEDSLDCVAKSFTIAARIYNNTYGSGSANIPALQADKDLSWNFSNQIGFHDEGFIDLIRLYNSLHTDHEGGNVSAHTAHLVGSALSDPFLSYSAALAGLAGPLHGLANQEVLRFILDMQKEAGSDLTNDEVVDFIWKTLNRGQVLPGYGHAVLRKPDPRFSALLKFGESRPEVAADPVFKLVSQLFQVAPGVLTEHGKTKNPFPNVDAASGSLLYHYGLKTFPFYTVTFGTSRSIGALSQLVWDRALGLPLERPKSLSMEAISKLVAKISDLAITAGIVFVTLVIGAVILVSRELSLRGTVGSIPKAYLPTKKEDVPKPVFTLISNEYDRACVIASISQPKGRQQEGWGRPGTPHEGVHFRSAILSTPAVLRSVLPKTSTSRASPLSPLSVRPSPLPEAMRPLADLYEQYLVAAQYGEKEPTEEDYDSVVKIVAVFVGVLRGAVAS
ncbi:citrate synthase [Pseudohyphozyma bogoriensis]|nr:citrate synthase [Pseudohyphozyma bogoriensis]